MKHAAATLGSGNLRLAVMLPEGEDLNEWVAVNSMLFFLKIFCYKNFNTTKVTTFIYILHTYLFSGDIPGFVEIILNSFKLYKLNASIFRFSTI